jgi:hypothetical protein
MRWGVRILQLMRVSRERSMGSWGEGFEEFVREVLGQWVELK